MAAPVYIDGAVVTGASLSSITFTMSGITHTTDDFLIAFVKESNNAGAQVWDDDGGGGNGWTREAYNRTTSGRDQETAVYWKFATSASEPNPTFTWAGTTNPMTGILLVYRGVDTNSPFTELTYANGTNDCNPPNPAVQVDNINTRVVCFHAATHDDISSVGAPTGFTIRDYQYGGSAGHTADHRDSFSADIVVSTTGPYSPPDWTHGASNTTPEWSTYSIALNEIQPIWITSPTSGTKYQWNDVNKTITGGGFEATQSTGKVELWSDATGTTKVTQSIDTWSDTSIQFDVTQGALTDGTNYLVVTNATGDATSPLALSLGFGPYQPYLASVTDADHYWPMQNAYTDVAARVSRPFNNVQTGTPSFVTTPKLCRGDTHSFRIDQSVESSEVADSPYTNITNTHQSRDIGGWVQIANLQQEPGIIIEEGGGVNNYYMLVNPNGRLVINIADDGDYKAQRYSDFALQINRTYHVLMHSDQPNKVWELYIDGEVQTAPLAGSLGTKNDMVLHSGDWTFGDADANLDTGGVDINYRACNTMYMAQWGTWSNTGGGAPLTATQIKNDLFRAGAASEHTISAGTQAAMQTAMDAFDSQTHADVPLTYDIEAPSSGGPDLELTLTDQVWPDEVKFQIRWLGTGVLTIRNSGTSNFDSAKAWGPNGGTFTVIETAPVTVTVRDITDNSVIQNARVYLLGAVSDQGMNSNGGSSGGYIQAAGTVASSTLIDTRIDCALDDWTTPSSQFGASADYYGSWQFGSSSVFVSQATGLTPRMATTTAAALGLVDGERTQLRCVLDSDANTADFYSRTGTAIELLSSDAGWSLVVGGVTLTGTVARPANASANATAFASYGGFVNEAAGTFFGFRSYDLDAASVDLEVYADDMTSWLSTGTFTGTSGETWTMKDTATLSNYSSRYEGIVDAVLTDASGQVTTEIDYTSSQPVTGRVRKAGTGTKYQTSPISATITAAGLDLTIFMIPDE